jgi:hypothetical protein
MGFSRPVGARSQARIARKGTTDKQLGPHRASNRVTQVERDHVISLVPVHTVATLIFGFEPTTTE